MIVIIASDLSESVETYCVDLTDFGKLRAVMEGLPVMDGVVNNAGVGMHAPFLEATEEQVRFFLPNSSFAKLQRRQVHRLNLS